MIQQTFAQILSATAGECSRRVAERALLANRMAKTAATPGDRGKAYAIKRRALEHGVAKFGERYRLVSLENGGELAAVRHEGGVCLHLPVGKTSDRVREWLVDERARVLREWVRVAR